MRHKAAIILDRLLPLTWSFRKQLLYTVSVGVVCFAVLASVITAYLQSQSMRDQLIREGTQIADNFAAQSVLALLVAAPENAADSVKATLAFPNVRHVAIYTMDGRPLVNEGSEIDWTPSREIVGNLAEQGSRLISESSSFLHFISPVSSHSDGGTAPDAQFRLEDPQSKKLGFVHVALSKEALSKAQFSIFANNIAALGFAGILLFALRLVVNRITSPLSTLSGVMQKAGEGEAHVRAELDGSSEVRTIAKVFNKMMAALEERDRQLREHNENLETLVSSRTQELVEARDQAVLANRHKSEFLANMSHELRTPLNAIIGYAEMVMEEMELMGNDEVVADLKRVHNAADHLLTMINTILDMAKIDAGRMDVWLEPVSLQDLLEEVADTVRVLVKKNHNQLKTEIECIHSRVMMDEQKLRQIMLNLLSNAVKFTKQGVITVKMASTEDALTITVSDTGIGMTDEQQKRIFEEFLQADMSTTREYGGTGLGLSITQRLCWLLGGEISVKSAPQKGSEFLVRIPLEVAYRAETRGRTHTIPR